MSERKHAALQNETQQISRALPTQQSQLVQLNDEQEVISTLLSGVSECDETDPESYATARPKRAVLYLRVSTVSQVKTDFDPEGISIPAQRRSCENKAQQLGIQVVDEYVEPGKTATSMDKRVEFQAMLERIRTMRDVDYVIVYKLSRMNRNRIEDGIVVGMLRQYGVSLLSATESIDDTPAGRFMHGVLAAMNQYRSEEDGADIKYKMSEKARKGGTLGRAPLGYRNERIRFEGREVRTVVLDEDRAPLIRLAFELYATGEWSLEELSAELTKRGLVTRPGRYAPTVVSTSKLQTMLKDRYYIGFVSYKGQEYEGRHEPLVSLELFERVQQVIVERSRGTRKRKHHHYLKGTLWCGRCDVNGVESRLVYSPVMNRHGATFEYFVCRTTKAGRCDARYFDTQLIEEAVEREYAAITFPPEMLTKVKEALSVTLADVETATRLRHQQLKTELARLDVEEDNLLDLSARGGSESSNAKIRRRLNALDEKRRALQKELDTAVVDLSNGAKLVEYGARLLSNVAALYRKCNDEQRTLLNQAIFDRIYIDEDRIVRVEYSEPFDELVQAKIAWERSRAAQGAGDAAGAPEVPEDGHEHKRTRFRAFCPEPGSTRSSKGILAHLFVGEGSPNSLMVELQGLEPWASSMPWKRSTT